MTVRDVRIRKIVITRSKEGNEELSSRLKRVGLTPIAFNTISFAPPKDWSTVDSLLERLHFFDWLVFTSVTGVKYFGKRMKELSLRLPWEGKPLIAAVGERTAAELLKLGVKPNLIPSSYLTRKLAEELPSDNGNRVLLLRADIADPKLSERLGERGFDVEEAPVYRTQLANSRADDQLRDVDLIVFASPSAVRGFSRMVGKNGLVRLRRVKAVCIGPVTAATAEENGFSETIIPESYTLDAVVDEIVRLTKLDD